MEDFHRSFGEWYLEKSKARKNWGWHLVQVGTEEWIWGEKSAEDRDLNLIYVELMIKATSTDDITEKRGA